MVYYTASVPEFSLNFPEDRKPIALKCRKVPFHLQNEVRGWIDELLDSHFIVPSRSEFAAPIVLVRKPNGGLRLCCDYTLLNRITPNDEYPIPRQDMLFSALEGKSIFAALDLKNGYFNIAVDKKSRHQTAFITPWGLFEWNRMPFGLKSAPAHFQRCLNAIFKGMMPQKCLIYLDDILVFGSNEEEFLNNLASVLSRLAEYNLFLNLEKCKIGVRRVRYLGFFISEKGRSVDPKRLEVMRQISPPTSLKELQALVGKLNFLREFIPDYSRAAEPLTRIMRKGYSISEWKEEQSTAWAKILDLLERQLTLEHPSLEGSFILRTDASTSGIG
ncbi:Retrovirus-related Pol polyprotein from transposon 17.6, partial [Aduncisulcus paluster]